LYQLEPNSTPIDITASNHESEPKREKDKRKKEKEKKTTEVKANGRKTTDLAAPD